MTDELRRLTDAVLYEGYVLWPYRRSAAKNAKRWTFGGVFPPRHNAAHPDDRAAIQAQCLVDGDDATVDVRVRFLHVVRRDLLGADGKPVDELDDDGTRHLAWDEATERELGPGAIEIAAGTDVEPLPGGGRIVRSWRALSGSVAVETERLRDRLARVTVRVENTTPSAGGDRDDALRSTFCSTHAVLRAARGAFVSLTDPADEFADEAAACVNDGVWPVLVGAEDERHTLLASPIILSDHTRIAPESPGDLFDAGEIDRLLILNVLSLTPAEQDEMAASDPRAREILERCRALGPDELLPLHGVIREFRAIRDFHPSVP
jgi:hypothetical protein